MLDLIRGRSIGKKWGLIRCNLVENDQSLIQIIIDLTRLRTRKTYRLFLKFIRKLEFSVFSEELQHPNEGTIAQSLCGCLELRLGNSGLLIVTSKGRLSFFDTC